MTNEWIEEQKNKVLESFAQDMKEILALLKEMQSVGKDIVFSTCPLKYLIDYFERHIEDIDEDFIKVLSRELDRRIGEIVTDFQTHKDSAETLAIVEKMYGNIPTLALYEVKIHKKLIESLAKLPELTNRQFEDVRDSEVLHIEGDIIITDPCYLVPKDYDNDWEGFIKQFGSKLIQKTTLYGDWSCTTVDSNTNEAIGEFCADAGLVCVCSLADILKVNPQYTKHIDHPYSTTWIKDFSGDVQIKIRQVEQSIEVKESKYHTFWDDFECFVEGHGINTKTGEKIDFFTTQTGI